MRPARGRLQRQRGLAVVAAVACVGLWPAALTAQGRAKVSYDVEFSTLGSLLDQTCSASGTDVLSGTLVGLEPPVSGEDNEYVGTLSRVTRINTCGTRRNLQGEDVVCSINIGGNGFADVILTVYEGGRGGWLQYLASRRAIWAALLPAQPPVGPVTSTVNGTCDPVEMAQLQNDYGTGSTAGSPSGQPIEVPGLPPAGYPATFPARPPVSIWTLKVIARRP